MDRLTVATICAALLVWFAVRPAADAPMGGEPEADASADEPEPAEGKTVT